MHAFVKILGTTSKFLTPEGLHAASFMLWNILDETPAWPGKDLCIPSLHPQRHFLSAGY